MYLTQQKLDTIVAETVTKKKNVYGSVFHVRSIDGRIDLLSASGDLKPESPYYIASINKLLISFLTHRFSLQNALRLEDKIANYLPEDLVNGLLVVKGKDYSKDLTIKHLLSQTSGFPCYLIDKGPDGKRNFDLMLKGANQSWPFQKVLIEIRRYQPKYVPQGHRRANYSETNFRILAAILEIVSKRSINDLLNLLFEELEMKDSWVLSSASTRLPAPIYANHQRVVKVDNYWDSTNYDVASTARDQMKFLLAFFSGNTFTSKYLKDMQIWNNVFFPFKYGVGIEKFQLPKILSPFKKIPETIGHAGSVGSVAFYVPEKQVFITGTINQIQRPKIAFQVMMKILRSL